MTNDYGNLELHTVLLSAMKDIDRICRENGLRYYLYAGTLLGAINHRGFIPWDDDVDIVMFPDDFKRLQEIIEKEFSEQYQFITFDNTPDWYSKMAKLRINGTAIVDGSGEKSPVFIDISMLHVFPRGNAARQLQRRKIELLNLSLCVLSGEVKPTSLLSKMTIGNLSKLGKKRLGKWLEKTLCRYDAKPYEDVGIMCNTLTANPYTGVCGYENDLTKREWHENYQYIPFENTKFMTISNPEADLLHRYGPHWHDPYPEEKRVTKHDVKSYYISDEVRKRVGL